MDIGHDEPSLLFYSNQPGSGYTNIYRLTLPKDPPLQPKQDGSGGTWNFQLRPAFWLGMAMCDDQSAPNPGGSSTAGPNIKCVPDSDKNIYDGPEPKKGDYIGKHPGTAFMEMQFYPPGWLACGGLACSATQWTAALNIDSDSENTTQVRETTRLVAARSSTSTLPLSKRTACPSRPDHLAHWAPLSRRTAIPCS